MIGDSVLRSLATKRLILQSGVGTYGIIINADNSTSIAGVINANGNSLAFPDTLANFKITLYNGFGFGIQSNELKYTSGGSHKFYTSSTNTFTIDNVGNVSCIGAINANGNSIIFPLTLADFKIALWNGYGFGVQSGELKYTSGIAHKFYTAALNTFTIDGSGNISCVGSISGTSVNLSGNSSSYIAGLRINGSDTINTIYQLSGDLGITTNTTNINLGMNTYGTKIRITPTNTTIYNNTIISASSEADNAILYLATPYTTVSAYKCAIIAQGLSSYSRCKLHFCLDSTADNAIANNASVANSRMSIDYNGNVVLTNSLTFKTEVWNYSSEGNQRIYFSSGGISIYQGYGQYVLDTNHEWRNHQGVQKMRLDNSGNLKLQGSLQCNFLTIANTNRDLTGIAVENTSVNAFNNTVLYCIQGTFTGFHRVYTDDELFNIDEPQQFKDNYEGRIVVSTGKIATDTTDNGIENNTEWQILYDKEGIAIEDALPKIELSRNKKDKRVFGVLGDKRRKNNRPERLIVNSVGEGSIWVINSNGNIENGDYITSSNYLGYGERQDDDILHNYTVAKATMGCDFDLDSLLYNCYEIDDLDVNSNKLRVAFIASTYHCG